MAKIVDVNTVYGVMYDDEKREIFVQKFSTEAYRRLAQRERKASVPYPVSSFDTLKTACKEAKNLGKRSTYTYVAQRNYID